MDLNPNKLLDIKNQLQVESQPKPNWFFRHLFEKILDKSKIGIKIILDIIFCGSIIYLAVYWRKFEITVAEGTPEEEELIVQVIQNGIDEYVYNNTSIENTNLEDTNLESNNQSN